MSQPGSGAIQNIRVGQFDRGTTRIVVELAPGYTIDPAQVKFRGITARQWTVQIPTPQLSAVATQPNPTTPNPTTPNPTTPSSSQSSTQLQAIQVTPDGIFVRTSGSAPEIRQSRSADRRQITLDLLNTTVALTARRDQLIGQFGVSRLLLSQVQSSPSIARVTLNVDPNSPDWQASVSNLGGVALIPLSGGVATQPTPSTPVTPPTTTPRWQQSKRSSLTVALDSGNPRQPSSELHFRLGSRHRFLSHHHQRGPALQPGERAAVQCDQSDQAIASPPGKSAHGGNSGTACDRCADHEPNQPNSRTLALQLQRPRPNPARHAAYFHNSSSSPPRTNPTPPTRPRVPNGKLVVIIDPGHGGPDPGAIGIRGIQEKEIVLDISRQVATLLEKQGVQAVLTREDDRDLDLEPRVQLAQQVKAALFVSIHANAIDLSRPEVNGLETYYYESGLELARSIHASVLASTGMPIVAFVRPGSMCFVELPCPLF
jgi:N-acetylmuramoyl-L-alanine amidase